MNFKNLSARARIRIHAIPEDVFALFADAEKMSKFWFTRRDNGLVEGDSSIWYLSPAEDAYSFKVQIKEIKKPEKIVIDWQGLDGQYTQVMWLFEQADDGNTILSIEESGFQGTEQSIIDQVLDSTGGFNQVIIAAKTLVEHNIAINLIADHI